MKMKRIAFVLLCLPVLTNCQHSQSKAMERLTMSTTEGGFTMKRSYESESETNTPGAIVRVNDDGKRILSAQKDESVVPLENKIDMLKVDTTYYDRLDGIFRLFLGEEPGSSQSTSGAGCKSKTSSNNLAIVVGGCMDDTIKVKFVIGDAVIKKITDTEESRISDSFKNKVEDNKLKIRKDFDYLLIREIVTARKLTFLLDKTETDNYLGASVAIKLDQIISKAGNAEANISVNWGERNGTYHIDKSWEQPRIIFENTEVLFEGNSPIEIWWKDCVTYKFWGWDSACWRKNLIALALLGGAYKIISDQYNQPTPPSQKGNLTVTW